jgi:hypothetical protein
LTPAGILGLGVAPSAWGGTQKSLQLPGNSVFAGGNDVGTIAGNNMYWDGSAYKYIATATANMLQFSAGSYLFRQALSGTAGDPITFTQAMALDASGALILNNTGGDAQFYLGGDSGTSRMYLARSGVDTLLWNVSNGVMKFGTNNTEAARLDSSGNWLVGTTSGSNHVIQKSAASAIALNINNSSATAPSGASFTFSAATPNDGTSTFFTTTDSTAYRGGWLSNGGIQNYQANDSNLSDRREKTNFAPAKNYLETICAIPVQTFNYIDQNMENDPGLTLGVVAQDVQAVAPEFVMESNWGTEEDPKMRLSLYQTDLQYALMKCIQEQQDMITSLTARIEALEGAK